MVKKVETLLKELGRGFEIDWDKALVGINYLPLVLLDRSREAIYNRDYFSARRILNSYSELEKIFHSENIPQKQYILNF